MTLALNEYFRSIQGEGRQAGAGAIFVRFAGCNLACPFCDTRFDAMEHMEPEQLVEAIIGMSLEGMTPVNYVVFTGGEPSLQLCTPDGAQLVDMLKDEGFVLAVETNGTDPGLAKLGLDWVTVSPKERWKLKHGNELKVVYSGQSLEQYEPVMLECGFEYYFLQPEDGPNRKRNAMLAARKVTDDPRWRLSIQLHKIAGVQ